jgi:hypothetical protein
MVCPACGSVRADAQLVLFGVCDLCKREMDAERGDGLVDDPAVEACERPGSAHLAFGDDAATALAKELEEAAQIALEWKNK